MTFIVFNRVPFFILQHNQKVKAFEHLFKKYLLWSHLKFFWEITTFNLIQSSAFFIFQHGQEVRASEHVTASLSKDVAIGDGESTSLPDVEKLQVHFSSLDSILDLNFMMEGQLWVQSNLSDKFFRQMTCCGY